MKPLQSATRDNPPRALEAELEARIDALFRRWPALLGFTVQEAGTLSRGRASGALEGELYLADMETQPWTAQPEQIFGEVAVALLELVDEKPAARELLRGRTFARTLH